MILSYHLEVYSGVVIMQAFKRLDIAVLGDRLHKKGKLETKAVKRLESKEPILRITKPSKRIVYGVKKMRKSVEPQPNAPLLKRIVKNPQGLDVGYAQKIKLERAKLEKRLVYEPDTTLRDYLRSDKRVRKMRPMELYEKAYVPSRPRIEEWIKSKGIQD